MNNFKVQVDKEIYFGRKYFTLERFVNYFNQLKLILEKKPKKILEIGVGDGTVSSYLRNANYDIITCDFDKNLKSDVLGDIRALPFADNIFDFVFACEVVEHLPFSDFDKALLELKRVSSKNVLISIPYNRNVLEISFVLKNLFLRKINKKMQVRVALNNFYKEINFEINGQHYWEMGAKNYSKKKIFTSIKKYFKIEQSFSPHGDSNHYFFLLSKLT